MPALHTLRAYAEAIVEGVKTEMPDASYFTRDDLLYLSSFQHVSTISRYRYICVGVRYAVDRKWILEMSRTDLILTGGKRRYADAIVDIDTYQATVARIINELGNVPFSMSDVLNRWSTDAHLTHNGKRVIIRGCFVRMTMSGFIQQSAFNTYVK